MKGQPEAWLAGPIEGIDPYLMPVAHALVQVGRDLENVADLTTDELWARAGDAAACGFHLKHIAGVVERLLTYAAGRELTQDQTLALKYEAEPGTPPADTAALVAKARTAIDRALDQVRTMPAEKLLEPRTVGRQKLPSTVLGLLYHAAEHATRHTGQAITTAKIVRAQRAG